MLKLKAFCLDYWQFLCLQPLHGFYKSVEGEAPSSETGTSLDSPSTYHQGPITHSSAISPDHYDHSAYGLYSVSPGQQRSRRPKLQHSTSILRKQAEEEAIKRSRSLSESYELSSDLQDKQEEHTPTAAAS
ncbi:IQ motif and SEC7 domain-containing protein 1-like isoform X2 [Alligator sinensis]|uniref:IQ motif and SEC7 domain-containing protein 1-like isoform X2 n=1 Tax=Alligator sinensis TaxID=38654 RepID=A0A3Q0GQ64_ALLSI|nr:IQ motif and SEC7 domain-containing protein 1-like isoform X2 [Alligator sinensis]